MSREASFGARVLELSKLQDEVLGPSDIGQIYPHAAEHNLRCSGLSPPKQMFRETYPLLRLQAAPPSCAFGERSPFGGELQSCFLVEHVSSVLSVRIALVRYRAIASDVLVGHSFGIVRAVHRSPHGLGARRGTLDVSERGVCARPVKVSQSSRQLAKVVPRRAGGELARTPKRVGCVQYNRSLGCVGHFGGRNPEDESHASMREAFSACSARFRRSSRSLPDGRSAASSLRRKASSLSRCWKGFSCLTRIR